MPAALWAAGFRLRGGMELKKHRLERWWADFRRGIGALAELQISVHAANAGYFLVLSVFPMLLLLLSLLRSSGLAAESLLQLLGNVLPAALMPAAERLIRSAWKSAIGTMASLSALTALWSASRGIQGLRRGLNAVYGVDENRGYLRTRLLCMGYTFLFLLVVLLTLVLQVFGSSLIRYLETTELPVIWFLLEVMGLRFFLLLGLQSVVFAWMYVALPNRANRFVDSLPGAVVASLGWLLFSHLFSAYVEHFHGYANVFGSVYGVALGMLWLYWCLSILYFGGSLNRWLANFRKRRKPG